MNVDASHLNEFTRRVARQQVPTAVLDALHEFTSHFRPLSVLGAARFPLRTSDWHSTQLGRDVFLHVSAPGGWWDEYCAMAMREYDPGVLMARSCLVGFTWSETMQMLDQVGIDRWPYQLSLKYGMRDALTCSVGRRWLVTYWSPQTLGKDLKQSSRIVLFAAASFAALRLEQLIDHDPRWMGKRVKVTPRELAVLRVVSTGRQLSEIAEVLRIGEETIRSHLKKVQRKLGVRNRLQAVAEAIRQQLIP